MKYDSKKIKKIIADRLQRAKDCDFKRAWIPNGWTVVKNSIFIKELEAEIREALK